MSTDSTKPREADKLPVVTQRPVEMQVLGLGLSRTSTMSLYAALNKLGYKSYHMLEVNGKEGGKNNHSALWLEALRAKYYGAGIPYGREEFDKILKTFSAVTDAPCVLFPDELIAAYPDAKVILTTRATPEKWVESMERSYYRIFSWPSWPWLCAIDTFIATYSQVLKFSLIAWTGGDWENRYKLKEGYLKHNEHVRSLVPKRNLLEFRPEQGWEPLCKFLGKPVPNEPYPRINEGTYAADLHSPIYYIVIARFLVRWLKWPVLAGMMTWGFKWYQRNGVPSFMSRVFDKS